MYSPSFSSVHWATSKKTSSWGTSLPFSPPNVFSHAHFPQKSVQNGTTNLTVIYMYSTVLTGGYWKRLLGYFLLLVCFGSSFINLQERVRYRYLQVAQKVPLLRFIHGLKNCPITLNDTKVDSGIGTANFYIPLSVCLLLFVPWLTNFQVLLNRPSQLPLLK